MKKTEKIFVQITSGRGPAECCWVVAQLLGKLTDVCKGLKLEYEVAERVPGPENGTLSSAMLLVSGSGVREKLSDWEGTVLWVGKSKFRKFHKRRNWYAGISFFETSESLTFRHSDLVFDTYRGSGPGGQHRNKVETAVRVTHLPSGVKAESAVYKSQMQNKKEAISKLEKAFAERQLSEMQQQATSRWEQHTSLERGNAMKVFEGEKFIEKRSSV